MPMSYMSYWVYGLLAGPVSIFLAVFFAAPLFVVENNIVFFLLLIGIPVTLQIFIAHYHPQGNLQKYGLYWSGFIFGLFISLLLMGIFR